MAGGLPVKDVLISPPMKYLLVIFDDGVTREQLENLSPNMSRFGNY